MSRLRRCTNLWRLSLERTPPSHGHCRRLDSTTSPMTGAWCNPAARSASADDGPAVGSCVISRTALSSSKMCAWVDRVMVGEWPACGRPRRPWLPQPGGGTRASAVDRRDEHSRPVPRLGPHVQGHRRQLRDGASLHGEPVLRANQHRLLLSSELAEFFSSEELGYGSRSGGPRAVLGFRATLRVRPQ